METVLFWILIYIYTLKINTHSTKYARNIVSFNRIGMDNNLFIIRYIVYGEQRLQILNPPQLNYYLL